MRRRTAISDHVASMLQEEAVFLCPLGLSSKCERLEKIERPFTNHHIDGDRTNSKYWNLVRICDKCHKEENRRHQDGKLQRRIKLRKRNLAIQYFGPLAINVLRMAYAYGVTSATPSMVLKLVEKGYLSVASQNTFSVGTAKHVTLQDYAITSEGKALVEKLIGTGDVPRKTFAL